MIAMDVSITYMDDNGEIIEEIVQASANDNDITLSSGGGANKLLLSTQQMRELLDAVDRRSEQRAA